MPVSLRKWMNGAFSVKYYEFEYFSSQINRMFWDDAGVADPGTDNFCFNGSDIESKDPS